MASNTAMTFEMSPGEAGSVHICPRGCASVLLYIIVLSLRFSLHSRDKAHDTSLVFYDYKHSRRS